MSDSVDLEIRTLQALYRSERDPDGLAFAPLADAFLRKGDLREALDLLSDGRARHPDFSTGHVIAARLYHAQGMDAEAELAARRVLELDADNIVALSLLGSVLDERGDEEAAAVHAALAWVDPESDEALGVAGSVEALPDVGAFALDDPVEGPVHPASDTDAPADGKAHDYADVDQEAPTEELRAIGQHDDGDDSFEDALGLAEAKPSEERKARVHEDELSAALDMLGLDEPAVSFDEPAEFEALRQKDESPTMDPSGLDVDPPTLEGAMDLGALAPDPEPVVEEMMDLSALAPDPEPEPVVEEMMDLAALAPDPEPEPVVEEMMDLGALAPDPRPEPVVEEVMDLAALAPDPKPVEEDTLDLGALAPDPDVLAAAAMEPADPSEEDPHMDSSEPVFTRTLAELYVSQGFTDKALDVYRHLNSVEPDAKDLSARIAELEGGPVGTADSEAASGAGAPAATEEEVETLARDLAEVGADDHEVDTPFAWSEDATSDVSSIRKDGSTIGGYFDQLLGWGGSDT